MDPHELERLIDRELRQIPEPRAPRTLLPRVMEAAGGPRSSGWAAQWRWIAAAAVFLAMAAVVPSLLASATFVDNATTAFQLASGLAAVMRVIWRSLLEPVVTYGVVMLLVIGFLGIASWKALCALTFEGASPS